METIEYDAGVGISHSKNESFPKQSKHFALNFVIAKFIRLDSVNHIISNTPSSMTRKTDRPQIEFGFGLYSFVTHL